MHTYATRIINVDMVKTCLLKNEHDSIPATNISTNILLQVQKNSWEKVVTVHAVWAKDLKICAIKCAAVWADAEIIFLSVANRCRCHFLHKNLIFSQTAEGS